LEFSGCTSLAHNSHGKESGASRGLLRGPEGDKAVTAKGDVAEGTQVKVPFNESIGPLFKNLAGFSPSKFRPRVRSRYNWACSKSIEELGQANAEEDDPI
jgi:hypothetical protein